MLPQIVLTLLYAYPALICFACAFLAGSAFILALSVLAGQGYLSLKVVLLSCLTGNLLADNLWYLVGKSFLFSITIQKLGLESKVEAIHRLFNRFKKSHGLFFLTVKFIYGTRIVSILFLGHQNYPYRWFVFYNTLASLFINTLLILAGFALGKGMKTYIDTLENIFVVVTGVALGVLGLYVLQKIFSKIIRTLSR